MTRRQAKAEVKALNEAARQILELTDLDEVTVWRGLLQGWAEAHTSKTRHIQPRTVEVSTTDHHASPASSPK